MSKTIIAETETVVIHGGKLLTCFLLLVNFLLKFSDVEEQSVNLGRPLDEDACLKLRAECSILLRHALLKLLVSYATP